MSIIFPPVQSGYLEILDVSNILYVATSVSNKLKDRKVISCNGVNIAGVTEIAQRIAMNYKLNRRTVLCMDSFSEKKNISSGYKANRVFHPEIAVQSQIIEQYFPHFGVNVLKKPGYEADDLIYSSVFHNYQKFPCIDVHTGDSDIYGVIIAPNVRIEGTSSRTPSIDSTSYPYLCDSKIQIPYNTILPNKVFYGKASNNVGVLKLSKPKDYYYHGFVRWLEQSGFDMSQGSDREVLMEFLAEALDGENKFVEMSNEEIMRVLDRIELIYPRITEITLEQLAPSVDVDALLKWLKFYNQYQAADLFGLSSFYNSAIVGKEYTTFIRRMYSVAQNGTFRADNHLGGDPLPVAVTTQEFMSLEEWS